MLVVVSIHPLPMAKPWVLTKKSGSVLQESGDAVLETDIKMADVWMARAILSADLLTYESYCTLRCENSAKLPACYGRLHNQESC